MSRSQTKAVLREPAWAKINLCLHVVGQRADGYHLLDSLVAFAGIGDLLSLDPQGPAGLSLCGPFGAALPSGGDNLVLRAADLFAPGLAVSLTLEKHLPPASGIGGGSADAAATWRLLALAQGRLADLERPDMLALAARLGADVPVCLRAAPARMRGIGVQLDPLPDFPGGWITLVNPGVEVPTPVIFQGLRQKTNAPLPEVLPHWPDLAALAGWLSAQRNDLEPPALAAAPVIATVLAALAQQQGALIARMSGSGATCFALFATQLEAEAAEAKIAAECPEWWVKSGRLFADAPPLGDQAIRETT